MMVRLCLCLNRKGRQAAEAQHSSSLNSFCSCRVLVSAPRQAVSRLKKAAEQ